MTLRSTINTREMELEILSDARAGNPIGGGENGERLTADYEHGQWWLTDLDTGAQWSVVDAVSPSGDEYFDFEQVTEGET